EKAYNAIVAQAEEATGLRKNIMSDALEVAEQWSRARQSDSMPIRLGFKHAMYDRLVYAKIRQVFGGDAKADISGAIPRYELLANIYTGIGLLIFECYKVTESTAPSAVNVQQHVRLGSVG